MTNAVTLGAAPDDNLLLLQGLNPPTPVGTEATNPMIVRAVAADGVTPVGGATIAWSSTNGAALSICGGTTSCSTITDDSGFSSTALTAAATGVANISATLAPGAYSSAKSVSGTLFATELASDIGVAPAFVSIAQGATLTLPLTARVMSNGAPQSGVQVNFNVVSGSGTLSSSSGTTDGNGYAVVNLSLTAFAAPMQVTACVAKTNSPCGTINANLVTPSQQNLQPVSGAGQVVPLTQAFQPVTVRVIDQSNPPNPVIGSGVTFQTTVLRPGGSSPPQGSSESTPGGFSMPVILAVSQSNVTSDANGLASITPSVGTFTGVLEVDVLATAGTNASLFDVLQALPVAASQSSIAVNQAPREENLPVLDRRPLRPEE